MLAILAIGLVAASASAVPPEGDFTVSPNPPNEDQAATFTCDPCPEGADVAWDFDGDLDFTDATGASVEHIFADAGLVTVRMRLSQDAEETVVPHDFTVNARPTVSFDFLPVSPLPGELVGFNQVIGDPDGDALTWQWRFGDGTISTLEDPQHAYATPGTRTVELEVSDARGAVTTDTRQVTVQDPNGPTANFTFSPAVPLDGAIVTFTNTSTPSAGQSITGAVWDLDDDGEFDDSPAGWSFGIPGNHAVSVRVTQSNGKQSVKQRNIRVNAPPTAAFTWSPLAPVGNQPVDLISTATDLEGLVAQSWDLDGDGQFDDANGPTVRHVFPRAGTYDVGQQVTDSDGVTRTMRRAVTVAAAVGPAQVEPRFITPFPIVRLAGKVLPHGAHIRVLAVRAPRRAVIQVRCLGKGCPIGSVRRTSRGRTVRFPQFERRLRAGIRLKLFMRQPGRIGKYTSFLIRAGSPPKRVDRCLYPTGRSLRRCP